jgi:hypothetical protein
MKPFLLMMCWLGLAAAAHASGHGPLFGYATPTNSQGEWSFDAGVLGRNSLAGSQVTARSMFTYGFTPHLQLTFSTPAVLSNAAMPMTRMTGGDDFESTAAWRFHHQAKAIGRRFESTVFGGMMLPGSQGGPGMLGHLRRAPGFTTGVASGIASRSHYVWLGGGLSRFMERGGDRRPTELSYSVVYGYRPPKWRTEPNKWDWRIFGELTGEKAGRVEQVGVLLRDSASHQVFVGPSALGIFRNYAVSFGVQVPVYRDVGRLLPRERVRFGINFSYFRFQHQH